MKLHYPKNEERLLDRPALRLCPFCGGRELEWTGMEEEGYYTGVSEMLYAIRCNSCGARGPVTVKGVPSIAHKLWNLR